MPLPLLSVIPCQSNPLPFYPCLYGLPDIVMHLVKMLITNTSATVVALGATSAFCGLSHDVNQVIGQ